VNGSELQAGDDRGGPPKEDRTEAGQAVYSPLLLRVYDLYVLGFTSRMIWGCPAPRLVAHYDANVGARHLDVGVGTGYFLDRCRFPVEKPEVVLMDMNRNSLDSAARRIARYAPEVVVADVLKPPPFEAGRFDSIGLNYLLHCLPSDVEGGKWKAFAQLAPLLRAGGVLFGATVLCEGLERNLAQRKLMGAYQRKGIFDNGTDSLAKLEAGLREQFEVVDVQLSGVVGVFSARQPKGK
jgi:ubiquinone/menaquinone biosynthesis C-methylase UbiE